MKLEQRKVARVLFDEYHSEAWSISPEVARAMQPDAPFDSSYHKAALELSQRDFIVERNADGPLTADALNNADVLVIAHPSDRKWEHTTSTNSPSLSSAEIDAIRDFVRDGGGLVVVGETEQDKYGNNLNELIAAFGIHIENATVFDYTDNVNVPSYILANGDANDPLLVQARKICFYRAGVLSTNDGARIVLHTSEHAQPPNDGLMAIATYGMGRVVVLTDSDWLGDEFICEFDHQQLWRNIIYWVAAPAFARPHPQPLPDSGRGEADWLALKTATNQLRQLQSPDGSIDFDALKAAGNDSARVDAERCVREMRDAIDGLRPRFPHLNDYLDCVLSDLQTWVEGGYKKPDFGKSLAAFNPQEMRRDGIEHLVVFPMYTPNGSTNTRFEALIVRVPWPDWQATLERTRFDNAKFVPLHFVDYTDGYESECAVLFPETVSVAGKAANNFGGIFCDREAKRYQKTVSVACKLLNVNMPPQLSAFLESPDLIRDTFALWDLIHDRWHSHGELPFDPFMIRQRLPYWMYSLEELRVDLQTFGSALELECDGFPFAKYVTYGILFDRIFRFPITGNRVRNYDGLGGQLLFAFLHKHNIVVWRDNRLTIDWDGLNGGVAMLREQIEQLYRDGIDMTKVQYWIAAHDLISQYVKPNIASKWAKETRIVSDESAPKEWIARVLDDEFPLSLFYLQLQKKI
jgi:uncharacterized membrane protein